MQIQRLERRCLLAAGDLDPAFGGGDGGAAVDFTGAGTGSDFANELLVQPDGKIILVGQSGSGGNNDDQIAIARFNDNGTPDNTFDGDGKMTFPVLAPGDVDIWAAALQADGKIVVGGARRPGGVFTTDYLLARFNSNGSIDNTFGGGDGIVSFDGGFNFSDTIQALAIQPSDGKIVATGVTFQATSQMVTLRFDTLGNLDNTFDSDGMAIEDFFGGVDFAADVIVEPGGKIVVTGGSVPSGSYRRFVLLRYDTLGVLDNTFDGDGKAFTDFGQSAFGHSILRQPDGKYVVGGLLGSTTTQNYAIARYESNGLLDSTFGTNAALPGTTIVTSISGFTFGEFGIARQVDGKIVFGGDVDDPSSVNTAMGLVRLTDSGALDSSFGGGVKQYTVPATTAGFTSGTDVALSLSGKILAGGYCLNSNFDFGVIQVLAEAAAGGSVTLNGTTLNVTGTDGDDTLTLARNGSNFDAVLNGVLYTFPNSSVTSLLIGLLGGNDTENHNGGVPGGFTDLGDGNDALNIGTGNTSSVLTVVGGIGNDTATYGVAGFTSISFTGGAGTDKLVYNGSQGNDTLNVDSNSVDDQGSFTAAFASTEQLQVLGNFGFDTINLFESVPTMQVTLDGGAGNDTFNVRNDAQPDGFQGSPTLTGGSDTDTIIFDDHVNTFDDAYTIGPSTYTRSFLGTFNFTAEQVQVIGSSGPNNFNVTPSSGTEFTIGGGNPTALPGDAITVSLTSTSGMVFTPQGAGAGRYTFTNRMPVNYTQMERDLTAVNTPPTVTSGEFLFETRQSVEINFSEDVSASVNLNDLTIQNLTTSQTFTALFVNATGGPGVMTEAEWVFATTSPLPDGNYRATLPAGSITDSAGAPLASNYTVDFFMLSGDINRDRTVDITDLGTLATNWQQSPRTWSTGNISYGDNIVNITDLGMLATNWQKTLAPLAAARTLPARARPARIIDQLI